MTNEKSVVRSVYVAFARRFFFLAACREMFVFSVLRIDNFSSAAVFRVSEMVLQVKGPYKVTLPRSAARLPTPRYGRLCADYCKHDRGIAVGDVKNYRGPVLKHPTT